MRPLFTVLLVLSSITSVSSQELFPGSGSNIDTATKKAVLIFSGQIEKIGPPVVAALGEETYFGVEVKVLQSIKGEVSGTIIIRVSARVDRKMRESAPQINKNYIFFTEKEKTDGQLFVEKLLPADDASISLAKQAMSQTAQ